MKILQYEEYAAGIYLSFSLMWKERKEKKDKNDEKNLFALTHLFVKTLYQVSDIPPQVLIEAMPLCQIGDSGFQRLYLGLTANQIVDYFIQVGFVASVNLV